MKKKCTKCGEEKPLEEFTKDNRKTSGRGSWCKKCMQVNASAWAKKNKEKCCAYSRKWRLQNIERTREYSQKYLKEHPDYVKQWSQCNREKCRNRTRSWQERHPERVKESRSIADAKKRSTPKGKLADAFSSHIRYSLANGTKRRRKWESLVGYNVEALKRHLEKQFKNGMNWGNYGKYWHVDHKIPVSVFNFEKPEDIDFKRCWSLKNLQPLEATENMIKSNKIERPFQPALAIGV